MTDLRTTPDEARILPWSRVAVTLLIAGIVGALLWPIWRSDALSLFSRVALASLVAMSTFTLFEHWPATLPRFLARWALQVVSVAFTLPATLFVLYVATTDAGEPPFWQVMDRLGGFALLSITSLLIGPWVALAALVRQKEAIARHQALTIELARSELARQALDARMRLLQAQIEPHFLFNTLANIRALVASASPKAPEVLEHLITYLRGAMPKLQQVTTTIGDEFHLVRSYLELMHQRMPDRLTFRVHMDHDAIDIPCPPMTLMTLVENAVKHGIDPAEEGGHIHVSASCTESQVTLTVKDTGAGLDSAQHAPGTGLDSLRQRLELVHGRDAMIRIEPNQPTGTSVIITWPRTES